MLAGLMAAAEYLGTEWTAPPLDTAHGAILAHITGGAIADSFQPMNVNFGLFPDIQPPDGKRKLRGRDRKLAYAARALGSFRIWAGGQTT
jgi:methylenetetrahydrofolate--tRNA-(uracil-5-)-methyltransferase